MPSDTQGNICGVDKGYENKPYVFFFDLTKCALANSAIFGCATPQICVEKCPDTYFFRAPLDLLKNSAYNLTLEKELKKNLKYCLPDTDMTMPYERLADGYHCPSWYTRSRPVSGRCLPVSVADSVHKLNNLSEALRQELTDRQARGHSRSGVQYRLQAAHGRPNSTSRLNGTSQPGSTSQPDSVTPPSEPDNKDAISRRVVQAAAAAVRQMRFVVKHMAGLTCWSLVLPLVLSLLFVLLLRWFVVPAIWLSLLGIIGGLLALTAVCGVRYQALSAEPGGKLTFGDVGMSADPAEYTRVPTFWLVLLIICAVLSVLMLVLLIALRKRIKLAVALLKQCSTAIGDMLPILTVPVFSFILQLSVCLMFVFVCLFLFGSSHQWHVQGECYGCGADYQEGEICYQQDFAAQCGDKCPDAACRSNQPLFIYAYNIFALVWAFGFVTAINQIAVAMAFCTWYFSSSKRLRLTVPALAYVHTLTYHGGTAAFGSLLITICRLARCLLMAAKKRLEKYGGCAARTAVCCCACCCWCLENCLQFINRRAYIVTALESVGLCVGGKRGLQVVMRNVARVAVADSITAFVLLLGRLLVVAGSVLLCHLLMAAVEADPVPWLLPSLFSAAFAYVVAGTTFALFDMGVDALFYCVMVDLEHNDGSATRPYMMSAGLASALEGNTGWLAARQR
ncbi:choline transporter-like 2 [Pollicipes pollicipes]|uniref:choline transporter-like 2 n=1 Tax=Pollicipes pollicipes TaxID=41117 RepID=UPI00188498B1|nr:choline transporter-like 2 [Pollicipes pollicipes]